MKRTVALVALAVAIAAVSSWAGASTSSKSGRLQVRSVRLVATNPFYVDNDPSGNSGGDLFGSTGDLRQNGSKVGNYKSACTASSPQGGQCQATLTWRSGGQL